MRAFLRGLGIAVGVKGGSWTKKGVAWLTELALASPADAGVRWLVAEAAWQGRRRSGRIRAYFDRVMRGDPQRTKIALVATAHHLTRVMAAVLRSGEAWREQEPQPPPPPNEQDKRETSKAKTKTSDKE